MKGVELDWSRRLKIALDSAKGLAYLHDHANPPIIHRDVKSTNILLDEELTAKVADFGLSLLVSDSEEGQLCTNVKGTLVMLHSVWKLEYIFITSVQNLYTLDINAGLPGPRVLHDAAAHREE